MGSLKAALKAFFPNNNGDTNFSSSCLVPYFDSSQNPKGCVTPSKLASVLGGASMYVNANDANEVTIPGFYQNSNWIANTPLRTGILIMPYYYTGFWKFQLFCDNTSTNMWFRSGTSSGYSPWKQIV